jgi:BirA family biotin operon repressor/biotin-[acetyl-CoA-carboxylase] ligase
VGLGLNVTEAPDPAATSLSMLGVIVDRTVLTDAVLRHLAARIGDWRAAGGADAALAADYRARSVTIGNRVRASLPGDRTIEGIAADVDDMGRLRIDTGQEQVVTVSAGDITHLRGANP